MKLLLTPEEFEKHLEDRHEWDLKIQRPVNLGFDQTSGDAYRDLYERYLRLREAVVVAEGQLVTPVHRHVLNECQYLKCQLAAALKEGDDEE